ncbi:tRNA dimethylallyltransferase [Corynebacterium pyruviciproducens ATCC BAA-1742]|uniref:tRNA dimethylallyltransferase n=1 Tax=Corynebacterium pyruviciproducens ATCC BAA-1742 TaxID=1125779 RepID=S2ZJY0_9CORY|nr:tRNA (adenosine(37)-N6)-dimethylallyltransferase MiaA [Corynebacterium pyruviciproducens]EPD70337.1 tRNA dimethylallyltransferase [Corynebacterium pyruviciproducens ATCC BAA-1742]
MVSPHSVQPSLTPIVIVGPTASGKSDLALSLCEKVGGEVVNMDSMQLYKGMDIGTAKLSPEERRGIPHHLLDIWEVTEEASVRNYQELAVRTVEGLMDRGIRPVLVGGSMMYYQSLVDSWTFPSTDPEVRAHWEQVLSDVGVRELHRLLAQRDPDAAETIEENDSRRTVRALEVIELTGKPYRASLPTRGGTPRWGATIVGLATVSQWLNPRIELRARRMFELGLVEETRDLVGRGLTRESTAGRAIGYAQVLDMEAGLVSFDEAVERTITGTRRYVRRQRSWFKRDKRIHWIDAQAGGHGAPGLAEEALDVLHLNA